MMMAAPSGIVSGGRIVVSAPPEKPKANATHCNSLAWLPSGRLQSRSPNRLLRLSCAEALPILDSSEASLIGRPECPQSWPGLLVYQCLQICYPSDGAMNLTSLPPQL